MNVPKQVTPAQDVGEWVARCRAGDRHAFRQLYDLHFAQVHRTARYLGTPPAELDDVTQEVFTSAFSKLQLFQGGTFAHWLHRICANVVTDRHRKRRVRETFAKWFGGETVDEIDRGPTPERSSERAEAERQVGQILARMRPKQREVFALFELEGLTGEEIAGRIGIPVNTVWTRLHHARQAFVSIGKKRGWVDPLGGLE